MFNISNLLTLVKDIFFYKRQLIYQLTKREISNRYKGSLLGWVWPFANPLLMLIIYTFVFSYVFKAKWGVGDESKTQFAIILFSGIIIHAFFSEVITRASTVVLNNSSLVKKVVFPVEILVIVLAGGAAFHLMTSLAVLLFGYFIFNGYLNLTLIYLPLVLLPLFIFAIGVGWLFSSLGVYLRDLVQFVGFLNTILLFISPVFFSVSSLPEKMRFLVMLNPLTFVIEQFREVVIWGNSPDFLGFIVYYLFSICVFIIGYIWFKKTQKGFADVL